MKPSKRTSVKISRPSSEPFESVEQAVKELGLDRRHKWFEWMGELVYNFDYTAPNSCSGCDGGGCQECGYTGKRKMGVPVPAFLPDGSTVKIKVNEKNN